MRRFAESAVVVCRIVFIVWVLALICYKLATTDPVLARFGLFGQDKVVMIITVVCALITFAWELGANRWGTLR